MYWALAVAMETAVPSYLSLEHKQALASNVIPVNMRESDEKGRDCRIPCSRSSVWIGFCVNYLSCTGCYRPTYSVQGHCWVIYLGRGTFTVVFIFFSHPSCFGVGLQMEIDVWVSQNNYLSKPFLLLVLSCPLSWVANIIRNSFSIVWIHLTVL